LREAIAPGSPQLEPRGPQDSGLFLLLLAMCGFVTSGLLGAGIFIAGYTLHLRKFYGPPLDDDGVGK